MKKLALTLSTLFIIFAATAANHRIQLTYETLQKLADKKYFISHVDSVKGNVVFESVIESVNTLSEDTRDSIERSLVSARKLDYRIDPKLDPEQDIFFIIFNDDKFTIDSTDCLPVYSALFTDINYFERQKTLMAKRMEQVQPFMQMLSTEMFTYDMLNRHQMNTGSSYPNYPPQSYTPNSGGNGENGPGVSNVPTTATPVKLSKKNLREMNKMTKKYFKKDGTPRR